MSKANVDVVKSLYEAFGKAIVEGVFARLGGEWEYFKLALEEVIDAGDTVVSRGRYDAAYKKTGGKINAQFVHIWKLRDGKVLTFQQHTDTLQVAKAIGG